MSTRSHGTSALLCAIALTIGCNSEDAHPESGGYFVPRQITMRESGLLKELVDPKLTFVDSAGVEWTAPQGTLTDGASVPRIALPITDDPYAERFLKAAVVHDAYCQSENEARTPEQYQKRPWREVHRMFYEACLAGGTPPNLAMIMYAAVWWGGPRWDDPDQSLQDVSQLTSAFRVSKRRIEESDPTLEEIEAWMDRRESVALKVDSLQLDALAEPDVDRAISLLREAEALLASEMSAAPEDEMLLAAKGYVHKTWGYVLLRLGDAEAATTELHEAESTFKRILAQEPEDPSALNGLGSVWAIRGDLDRAEAFVRKAIELAPHYEAALLDLQAIEEAQARREGPG